MSDNFRVCITGSRNFSDFNKLKSAVTKILNEKKNVIKEKDIVILTNMEEGSSRLGISLARDFDFKVEEYHAMWDNLKEKPCKIKLNKYGRRYNSLAGFNRNKSMINSSDIVILVNDEDCDYQYSNTCEYLNKDYINLVF